MARPRPLAELRDLAPDRVCLIKPSSLGDIVNALPVLEALRALWPAAKMTWVVNRSLSGLLDGHPALDDLIIYDRDRAVLDPPGVARFLTELRGGRFDVTIDLQGLLRSGIMAATTRAPIRVGRADAREGATRFYTHRVNADPPDRHIVDRLLDIAGAFGAETTNPTYVFPIGKAEQVWARETLSGLAAPRMVFHLGARWVTKRWPPRHFAEIARRAIDERGASVVTVGAAGDRTLIDEFQRHSPGPFLDLCGRTTLRQLAAVADESDVLVSNDSGPLHLAAATRTRVVGIYTCTSAKLNGPYGPRAAAVESRIWCAGSHLRKCDRLECFAELNPDRVWPAVRAQLDGQTPAAAAAGELLV